jgi:hypothetical protein
LHGHSSVPPLQGFRSPPDSRPAAGDRPSHTRTAASTAASGVGARPPNFLRHFARGIVTKFWASNTPGRRTRVLIATAKRDPRGLVVGATAVTRARSCSATGTLRTRHGLTVAARPQSTSPTSPRCVAGIGGFSTIECEQAGCCVRHELLICAWRKGDIPHASQEFASHDLLCCRRQALKGVEKRLRRCCHAFHPCSWWHWVLSSLQR